MYDRLKDHGVLIQDLREIGEVQKGFQVAIDYLNNFLKLQFFKKGGPYMGAIFLFYNLSKKINLFLKYKCSLEISSLDRNSRNKWDEEITRLQAGIYQLIAPVKFIRAKFSYDSLEEIFYGMLSWKAAEDLVKEADFQIDMSDLKVILSEKCFDDHLDQIIDHLQSLLLRV
ncbi:MAG: hypothetical protein ACI9S8_001957 [Chlamydiales bacterium]|jgi:hypothetical protein